VLFLTLVSDHAHNLTVLKMPIGDGAQDFGSLQSRFAFTPVQLDPSKENGRRVEAAASSWA
jgi:hypothetical protein